jgi:SPP1 gp7 family putative phage head morphogenesis protein
MSAKRGQTFGPAQRLEKQYAAAIGKITRRILAPIKPEASLEEWLNEIAERSQAADVQEASDLLARQMCHQVNIKNARTWREAAAKSQRSRELHRLLQKEMEGPVGIQVQRLIQANAGYISSVPLDAARVLASEVTKAQQAGARAGTISKMMKQRFPELLRSRVHLISRTEVSKASLALTEARCQELNIEFAEWLTSDDVRVRTSHKLMNKVIFPWNDLPSPERLAGEKSSLGAYGPGGCPNCRCVVAPVLALEDIHFPAKVYHSGSIKHMNKQQFLAAFSSKNLAA